MGCSDQGGLSVAQAAQVLGVSRATVCRWSDMGHLTSSRDESGERRFSQEQIDRLIELLQRQHAESLIDREPG
jgi:excisionase family DNA binding protein